MKKKNVSVFDFVLHFFTVFVFCAAGRDARRAFPLYKRGCASRARLSRIFRVARIRRDV